MQNIIKMCMIGRRLRNLRKSLSLSRREIEHRHGISVNSLKAWETGVAEIGVIRLISYLKIIKQYSVNISIGDLLQTEENYLDDIHPKNLITPFSNHTILPSANNNKDVELVFNTFKNEMTSLLNEKDTILKTLINNLPFQITLKDEHNNFLLVNNLFAVGLGGITTDFEGKSCYDLLPAMAKKYHEEDLKIIATNTSLVNKIYPHKPPNKPLEQINVNVSPIIHQETNKKMVLVIAYTVG